VVVAHAGTIRAALALALELRPERGLAFVVDPLSVTRIDRLISDAGEIGYRLPYVNFDPALPIGAKHPNSSPS
jgi:alpha-ribazole phosphatase